MRRKILCFSLVVSLVIGTMAGVLLYKAPVKIHADETNGIEVSVLKVWDDYNDIEELRPESIEVTLYQNDVETNVTATLSANNNWYYKHNVPVAEKDNNGDKINYTWRCDSVDGYERYTDNLDNMYIITDVHHYNSGNINVDSVVLQKLDENHDFFDDCNMRLKDDEGHTLITWTTNDDESIEVGNSGLNASMNSDGSLVVQGLPAGEYVYEEVAPKDGYTESARKEFKIENGSHNYTYNWYTDIEEAVADANNLTISNADCLRDDEDCEAGLFIMNSTAYLILLKDKNYCSTISFLNDTVFDLDDNTLSFSADNQIDFGADLKVSEGNIITDTARPINGTSAAIGTASAGSLEIDDVELSNTSDTYSKTYGIYADSITECIINDSEINNTASGNISSSDFHYGVYIRNTSANVEFNNSSFNVKATDSNFVGYINNLLLGGSNISLNNCNVESDSYGVEVVGVRPGATTSDSDISINGCNIDINNKITNKTSYHSACFLIHSFAELEIQNCDIDVTSYSENGNKDNAYGVAFASNNSTDSHFVFKNNTVTSYSCYCSRGLDIYTCSCDMFDNTVRCELPVGVPDLRAWGVTIRGGYLHFMSGNVWSQPARISSEYTTDANGNNNYDSSGCGVYCDNGSTTVIDESKGDTIVSGGNCGVTVRQGSNVVINAGTFKSPNHGGAYILCGSEGSCEINGGLFKANNNEYSQEMLNGVSNSHGGIYFGYNGDLTVPWSVNVRNATITGGTYGVRIKSNNGYKGAIVHFYNCYIKGNSCDIWLDKTATSENAYCYIENGTVLDHDGTGNAWNDGYANSGDPPHIIDNRTPQETVTEGGE